MTDPLHLEDGICLAGVHFRYGPEQPRGLELEICRGERIGLIGNTGSGKSTTVNLLMPSAGRMLGMGQICMIRCISSGGRPGGRRSASWR